MLCQRCSKRQAKIQVTQVRNGKRANLNLCEQCAAELGVIGPVGSFPSGMDFINEFEKLIPQMFGKRSDTRIFEAFSEAAHKVILRAQEEAIRLGQKLVSTELLLLGLIKEEGMAYRLLQKLKVDLVKIFSETEQVIGQGKEKIENPKKVIFDPRTKQVLELAYQIAMQFGFDYVGPEHMLLGLLQEGESVAAQLLNKSGITYEDVVKVLFDELGIKAGKKVGEMKPSFLGGFGRDLTVLARQNKLDPVIGREKEIEQVVRILSRRTKNNPALVGDPGVGKTAIAEGLAQEIVSGNIPEILKDKSLVELDLTRLVAGTKFRGEFEERLKKIMDEIKKQQGKVIIFIDELHSLVGTGSAEGSADAGNILKPALARGELQCIGATTLAEYRKYIEKDSALERRFHPVMVDEPSLAETYEILQGLRDRYEAHHRVALSDEVLKACVNLSSRYISDRFLPDKAIDLMDEAAAKVRIESISPPPELRKLQKKIQKLRKEISAAEKAKDKKRINSLKKEFEKLTFAEKTNKEEWSRQKGTETPKVTEEDLAKIVSDRTGIPVFKLEEKESKKLKELEKILAERVVGQPEALKIVSEAIRRSRAGVTDPLRPTASFLFVGPSGVGKTELARALAEFLFGTQDKIIRFDMSEFVEKHTVSKLIGSPPGYVGYDEGGKLTDAIRRNPYSVLLFDEIEKAHPDVFNLLLQIFDEGHLTDAKGRKVNFKNAIIILTSNVGTGLERKILGFEAEGNDYQNYERLKNRLQSELKNVFRPEFLNRLDDIVVFRPLEKEQLKQIVDILIKGFKQRLKAQDIEIELSAKAKDKLVEVGFNPSYGARPLKRAIQKNIENPLALMLIDNKFKAGDKIKVDVDSKGEFKFLSP